MIEGEVALYLPVLSPRLSSTRVYSEKQTRMTHHKENLAKGKTSFTKKITSGRQEHTNVTVEASVFEDESVKGVNSGRLAKENHLLEVCFSILNCYLLCT